MRVCAREKRAIVCQLCHRLTWPERHLGRPGWCVPVAPTVSPDGQKPAAVWVGLPAGPGPPGSAVPLHCFLLLRSESRMASEEFSVTQQQQNTGQYSTNKKKTAWSPSWLVIMFSSYSLQLSSWKRDKYAKTPSISNHQLTWMASTSWVSSWISFTRRWYFCCGVSFMPQPSPS